MYGYIRPEISELRLSEYTYYRGVYCGLCRRMGRCTGQCSRLTLNYDAVCLALFRLALTDGQEKPLRFSKRHCAVHPFTRRPTLTPDAFTDGVLDYVACAGTLLLHFKLKDDGADERGYLRGRAVCASAVFSRAVRRAKSRYPGLYRGIETAMASFARAEAECSSGVPSADRPADAFGEVLALVFSHGLQNENARIAAVCGRHLGRWLYLLDAVDDYEADIRKKRFNPLRALYAASSFPSEASRRALNDRLQGEVAQIGNALDLIPFSPLCGRELAPLLDNVIRLSLPRTAHRVLFPEENVHRKEMDSV